jgi:hypothetical protein
LNFSSKDTRDYVSVRKKFTDLAGKGSLPPKLQSPDNLRADLILKKMTAKQASGVLPNSNYNERTLQQVLIPSATSISPPPLATAPLHSSYNSGGNYKNGSNCTGSMSIRSNSPSMYSIKTEDAAATTSNHPQGSLLGKRKGMDTSQINTTSTNGPNQKTNNGSSGGGAPKPKTRIPEESRILPLPPNSLTSILHRILHEPIKPSIHTNNLDIPPLNFASPVTFLPRDGSMTSNSNSTIDATKLPEITTNIPTVHSYTASSSSASFSSDNKVNTSEENLDDILLNVSSAHERLRRYLLQQQQQQTNMKTIEENEVETRQRMLMLLMETTQPTKPSYVTTTTTTTNDNNENESRVKLHISHQQQEQQPQSNLSPVEEEDEENHHHNQMDDEGEVLAGEAEAANILARPHSTNAEIASSIDDNMSEMSSAVQTRTSDFLEPFSKMSYPAVLPSTVAMVQEEAGGGYGEEEIDHQSSDIQESEDSQLGNHSHAGEFTGSSIHSSPDHHHHIQLSVVNQSTTIPDQYKYPFEKGEQLDLVSDMMEE